MDRFDKEGLFLKILIFFIVFLFIGAFIGVIYDVNTYVTNKSEQEVEIEKDYTYCPFCGHILEGQYE